MQKTEDIVINHFKNEFEFLSNFYKCTIVYCNISYPSNEHFYQAMKTTDRNLRKKIAHLHSPGQAKKMGGKLELRSDWEEIKIRVMKKGIELKFKEGTILAEMLRSTYPAELIEGNYWGDTFWGCDLKKDGIGENWLGKLLTNRRDYLLKKVK